MRTNYILLGLVTLTVVIGLYLSSNPEHGSELARMNREAAFTGEGRDMALTVLAFGIAAFIGYLAFTRR